MNKYILVIFLFASCNSPIKKTHPVIRLEKDSLNLGNIKMGDSIKVKLKVFNQGNDTLKIANIGVSCGCTAASIDKKEILPGDSSLLHLTYDNTKSSDSGYMFKSIVIRNNSSETFKILRIAGNIY
jgi:Protein of unknown function (DUF1573)